MKLMALLVAVVAALAASLMASSTYSSASMAPPPSSDGGDGGGGGGDMGGLKACETFGAFGDCSRRRLRCRWIPGKGCRTKNNVRTVAPNHKPTTKSPHRRGTKRPTVKPRMG